MTSPVLIVTYARSSGLIRLLESCANAGVKRFYVAVDGARNQIAFDQQAIMKKHLAEFQLNSEFQVKVWWRTENLGPAVSVLTAIDWFFRNESEGIVLEDDLETEPDFFRFADDSLESYRNFDDVWIVSGSRIIEPFSESPKGVWSRYPMTWGWATWAHKWELMYRELLSTPRTSLLSFFNRRANYWDIGAQRSKAGLIDAWDLPLASAQFRLKKLTLIPPVNLIKNIGFDSQATHTTSDIFPLNILTFELPSNYQQLEMQSPKTFDYDQKLEEKVYRISTKHSLLRIWAFFSDRLFFKSIYESPLAARIERVLIPNSPKAP